MTPNALAQVTRQLAAEPEAGTGPRLLDTVPWEADENCGCAMGTLLTRAGWRVERSANVLEELQDLLARETTLPGDQWKHIEALADAIIVANDDATDDERPRAVMQPLRALAEALEAVGGGR